MFKSNDSCFVKNEHVLLWRLTKVSVKVNFTVSTENLYRRAKRKISTELNSNMQNPGEEKVLKKTLSDTEHFWK